jgi:flagellar biosynthesis component FlhA
MNNGINFDYIVETVKDIAAMKNNTDPAYEPIRKLAAFEMGRVLEAALTSEELEVLKLMRENEEVLNFIIKNKDVLRRTRKIGGVLRTP